MVLRQTSETYHEILAKLPLLNPQLLSVDIIRRSAQQPASPIQTSTAVRVRLRRRQLLLGAIVLLAEADAETNRDGGDGDTGGSDLDGSFANHG